MLTEFLASFPQTNSIKLDREDDNSESERSHKSVISNEEQKIIPKLESPKVVCALYVVW